SGQTQVSEPTFRAELNRDGSSMARRNVKKAVNVKEIPVDLPRHHSADSLSSCANRRIGL
ncbi:MAG: hypothetical protein ACRED2_07485, partial [Methylocella sp.]